MHCLNNKSSSGIKVVDICFSNGWYTTLSFLQGLKNCVCMCVCGAMHFKYWFILSAECRYYFPIEIDEETKWVLNNLDETFLAFYEAFFLTTSGHFLTVLHAITCITASESGCTQCTLQDYNEPLMAPEVMAVSIGYLLDWSFGNKMNSRELALV